MHDYDILTSIKLTQYKINHLMKEEKWAEKESQEVNDSNSIPPENNTSVPISSTHKIQNLEQNQTLNQNKKS